MIAGELRAHLAEHPFRGSAEIGAMLRDNFRAYLAYSRRSSVFKLQGRSYHYFAGLGFIGGRVDNPWSAFRCLNVWSKMASERPVEVAIAAEFLEALDPGARVLEVGNVMRNYLTRPGTVVVDKFEIGSGIVNEDVLEFSADRPFEAILSISTLEHVGFDEPQVDLAKAEQSLSHLRSLLAADGKLLVTVPVGYHPGLDEFLAHRASEEYRVAYLANQPPSLGWEEVDFEGLPRFERHFAVLRQLTE